MEFFKGIIKIGNSKGIILPVEIIDYFKLQKGDILEISIIHGSDGNYIKLDPKKE